MIKVGIIGGAGYTAGELIRLLINHPQAAICFVHSSSHAGEPVYHVHQDLTGDTELVFTGSPDYQEADVLFLCMGHGRSKDFVEKISASYQGKIIDLSHDFRLHSGNHDFVYGLPEYQREKIKEAVHIANPGCFATAIQLALLPLGKQQQLTEVHVHALTGSTGAGQAATATTHFSWRNNNVSVYKPFQHQHLAEITETLKGLQADFSDSINFIPMRGNFSRGILASVYLDVDMLETEAVELYKEYYKSHPFVHVVNKSPDVKLVVNTNKALLHVEKHGDKIHVVSVIDNLLKGASGQAVQNMNLIFGLDETTGLQLKPSAF